MKAILLTLTAIVIALVLFCEVEAAPAGWTCGPNGCGPARVAARASGPRFAGRLRARRPVRNLLRAILGR